ncbi:MAG: hypothetical protein QOJ27_1538, partial [Sphingomonadales bacterium]|nr:hypothetical protein [Sphingomonadales bacterium]
ALMWFYKPLAGLLDRSTKIGLGPISLEAAQKKLEEVRVDNNSKAYFSAEEINEHTARFSKVLSDRRHANLLWVDDDPEQNKVFVDFLELFGIKVVVARSLPEAVDRLQERSFSAVVTDWDRRGDPAQQKARADGEKRFWGAGARLGLVFANSKCERNVMIFSWESTPDKAIPPGVAIATNDYNVLLRTIANMIETPVARCVLDPKAVAAVLPTREAGTASPASPPLPTPSRIQKQ